MPPIMSRLSRDSRKMVEMNEIEAAIAKQVGVSPELFKKYNG